jgi:DNA (cytosine-5)-methyltransferase 1
MAAYYNENDLKTAAWLRELIKQGLIADGEVDTRSITDVQPADLAGFTQCHFFAGIGGWSYALRLAGWPDDRAVWTGSCPCQPFSTAGKGDGADDSRHLWPVWFGLIRECAPPVVFGEQVASADGLGWLDLVCADMEGAGYAIGAADLCAAGLGAPHIRQRLWFVAKSDREQLRASRPGGAGGSAQPTKGTPRQRERLRLDVGELRPVGALDNAERQRAERTPRSEGRAECAASSSGQDEGRGVIQAVDASSDGVLGHAHSARHAIGMGGGRDDASTTGTATGQAVVEDGATRGAWANANWIACTDGKSRPVESGTFPLAYGLPARVGRLRGYGNAIVPQVAAEVIKAYREVLGEDLHGL